VSKKKLDKLPEMKEKFINGYVANTTAEHIHPAFRTSTSGADAAQMQEIAHKIWGMYFSECSYLFNKSHAVGYSVQTMRTAWLKTHYITEFMTAALQQEDKKVPDYIWECLYLGLKVFSPHFSHSKGDFAMLRNRQISFGIFNIKYVSKVFLTKFEIDPVKALLETANKKMLTSLIHAGVYDGWNNLNRKQVYDTISLYKTMKKKWDDYKIKASEYAEKVAKAAESGKNPRGKAPEAPEITLQQILANPIRVEDYTIEDKIAQEEALLGYSFSDPDYEYKPYINAKTITGWRQIGSLQDQEVCEFFGSIEEINTNITKSGKTMFRIKLKYAKSYVGITMFDNTSERYAGFLNTKEKMLFKCKTNIYYNEKRQKSEKGFTLTSIRKITDIVKS
jgi:DNA polymerase III alpha subunit